MGCDIHSVAIDANGKPIDGGIWADCVTDNPYYNEGEPFGNRNYSVFGFLAGVRNYSAVQPISEPRGLPKDFSCNDIDGGDWLGDHSFSWLSLAELEAFNYEGMMEDRRYTGHHPIGFISGAMTADPGRGAAMTWREFLGEDFFKDIAELRRIGADRVVFGFDS